MTTSKNPAPCVGALIVRDGRILLTKRKHAPFKGWWDIPGGFMLPAEHPVEALKSDVRESRWFPIGNLPRNVAFKNGRSAVTDLKRQWKTLSSQAETRRINQ